MMDQPIIAWINYRLDQMDQLGPIGSIRQNRANQRGDIAMKKDKRLEAYPLDAQDLPRMQVTAAARPRLCARVLAWPVGRHMGRRRRRHRLPPRTGPYAERAVQSAAEPNSLLRGRVREARGGDPLTAAGNGLSL